MNLAIGGFGVGWMWSVERGTREADFSTALRFGRNDGVWVVGGEQATAKAKADPPSGMTVKRTGNGKCNGESRSPSGMTTRKTTATAKAWG
jgi:hypothetical protein